MKYAPIIESKLSLALKPTHLEILNESPSHGLPLTAERHFRVVVVSEHFVNLSRLDRHRKVHDLLADEIKAHIHALSVKAFTPEEWQKSKGETAPSPECFGGGKREGLKG